MTKSLSIVMCLEHAFSDTRNGEVYNFVLTSTDFFYFVDKVKL